MKLYLRYIVLIIGLEIIMIVFFDFEKWVTILISVTIGMGLYFSHLLMLEINRVRLINNKCDPESYIQMTIEMKKSKYKGFFMYRYIFLNLFLTTYQQVELK